MKVRHKPKSNVTIEGKSYIPFAKAREMLHDHAQPMCDNEIVSLRRALGSILARDLTSPINVPPQNNSAMDGYAVRHENLHAASETRFTVIGTAYAGLPFHGQVGQNEAIKIMTGACIPNSCDTVIPQENARFEDRHVYLNYATRGQYVRLAGEDLREGQIAIRQGTQLRPAHLGLIASLGIDQITVYRRLRVAFFSTGDELRSPGVALQAGQIYDSNGYTLYGMLDRLGFDTIDMGTVADDPAMLKGKLLECASIADVIISSGGVSVGEADFVKPLLQELGEVIFWKIAMKPGRPLAYGKIGKSHFFGLPGNPVSAMVTFYQLLREPLLTLAGCANVPPAAMLKAICKTPLKKVPGRMEFQRGIASLEADGSWQVRATGAQGSGILSSIVNANCFIVLSEPEGNVGPGSVVDIQLFEGLV